MKFFSQPKAVFSSLVVFLLLSKLITLLHISFVFTGNDDLIFWTVAKEYAQGIFTEPFMYGQNYNYAVESFLSVPLIWLGVPFQYALPVTTAIMGVFPFLVFAWLFYKKGFHLASYIWLAIPIAMPIEYDIMTTIPRGFINGLFFTGFLAFSLFKPNRWFSFVLFGFFAATGYVVNASSLVFAFPIGLYLFFQNFKNWRFYLLVPLAAILPLVLFYYSKVFYLENPEYQVHGMWILSYSFQRIGETFVQFDRAFKYLTPVFWFANWWIVPALFLLGIYALKRNWKLGTSLILAMAFVIFSLGVNKVEDGVDVVFYEASRMFLSLPLILAFGISFLLKKKKYSNKITLGLVSLALVMVVFKWLVIKDKVTEHTTKRSYGPVAIEEVSKIKSDCEIQLEIAKKYNVDLVIYPTSHDINTTQTSFGNYGCPLLIEEFPRATMIQHCRKNIQYQELKTQSPQTVLLVNYKLDNTNFPENEIEYLTIPESEDFVLIQNNDLSVPELAKKLGLKYERHKW